MNCVLAISGGVDSVVLLDMFSKTKHHLIVAHVDHGIRGIESAADARFVEALASKYKAPFVSTELHLLKTASEETARSARYKFLLAQAKEHNATLITAHHQDDAVETIAINISRGTGWRGLAILGREGVLRPLIGLTKQQIYQYAVKQRLEWVEDATNRHDVYLRNQLRWIIGEHDIDGAQLMHLRARQLQLRQDINTEVARLRVLHQGSRYFIGMIPVGAAIELLGAEIANVTVRPTRPRLERAVQAIKTAGPGSVYQVGDGINIEFTARNYRVALVKVV